MALLSAVILPLHTIKTLFSFTAYYFVLASFLLWLLLFILLYFHRIRELMKTYCAVLFLAVILTTTIFIIAPPRFKVLNDEPNLIGVSMMMFHEKKTAIPLHGYYLKHPSSEHGNQTSDYELHLDKRPVLYPLLVSFVHTLTGYSGYNGMVVNFLASIFILLFFYIQIRNYFPAAYSIAAILMMAASPIYVFYVTSSGFETINVLFIILMFILYKKCMDTGDSITIELFFLTIVLLFQCRYESKLFAIAILFLIPVIKHSKKFRFSFITCIIPILMLPSLWQQRIGTGASVKNQFENNTFDIASKAFSLDNLFANFPKNIFTLSGLDPNLGFTPVIFILSIAGLYLIIRGLLTGTLKKKNYQLYKILPLGLTTFLLLLLIISAYYWGDFTSQTTNRLALASLPFSVFTSVYCIYAATCRFKKLTPVFMILFSIFHLLYYWPVASQQKILNHITLHYEYNKSLGIILPRFENYKTLIICERPNLYIIHHYSAFSFDYANKNKEWISKMAQTYYDNVIIIQNVWQEKNIPHKFSTLDPLFTLKEITRFNKTNSTYVKISKLVR